MAHASPPASWLMGVLGDVRSRLIISLCLCPCMDRVGAISVVKVRNYRALKIIVA